MYFEIYPLDIMLPYSTSLKHKLFIFVYQKFQQRENEKAEYFNKKTPWNKANQFLYLMKTKTTCGLK